MLLTLYQRRILFQLFLDSVDWVMELIVLPSKNLYDHYNNATQRRLCVSIVYSMLLYYLKQVSIYASIKLLFTSFLYLYLAK
mgnify:CR=1 FL=1